MDSRCLPPPSYIPPLCIPLEIAAGVVAAKPVVVLIAKGGVALESLASILGVGSSVVWISQTTLP